MRLTPTLARRLRRCTRSATAALVAGATLLPAQGRELTPAEQAAHALSRLTFGARPGDVERVLAMGVDKWIARQLRPAAINDFGAATAVTAFTPWAVPSVDLAKAVTMVRTGPATPAWMTMDRSGQMRPEDASIFVADDTLAMMRRRRPPEVAANQPFFAGKIAMAQLTERQLLEVVTDFWENHFSVFTGKQPSPEALASFSRDAIRPRALGRFRDILSAVARHPMMLFYLDNHLSTATGLNENYARELLELHTLGADGGYTQQDVIEVARALTGWSITPMPGGTPGDLRPARFAFRVDEHDTGSKVVLGKLLPAGRGLADGDAVLDLVAAHPATARHIATKLARRFVSDTPPASLVARAAARFLETQGDIAQVVATIVTSDEFFSRDAFRAKVKTPFEFVVSARRALSATMDDSFASVALMTLLGQPMFGRESPDGWPDYGEPWMSAGAMLNRTMLITEVVERRLPYFSTSRWRGWETLDGAPRSEQVDGVVRMVLSGIASPATRETMLGSRDLRGVVAVALGSPEFQRR